MSAYDNFAPVYDVLMGDVNYKKRTDYILKLFKKYDKKPDLLLDVACGTGGFSLQFAKKGIEVIGTDMSEEMLAVAREQSAEKELDILFLCQKAEDLDLYGTVDGAVCCMDSLNHITDKRSLKKAFGKISLFLEKDRLFIFDVNTVFKHREILGNNTFALEEDGVYCVWQNEFLPKTNSVKITLDFFIENENGYARLGENFSERAYDFSALTEMLNSQGFEVLAIFDDLTENPPRETSERVFFVCKKTR